MSGQVWNYSGGTPETPHEQGVPDRHAAEMVQSTTETSPTRITGAVHPLTARETHPQHCPMLHSRGQRWQREIKT